MEEVKLFLVYKAPIYYSFSWWKKAFIITHKLKDVKIEDV